jgi:hypothetical protein
MEKSRIKMMDCVGLIVEKGEYAKEGVRKGMQSVSWKPSASPMIHLSSRTKTRLQLFSNPRSVPLAMRRPGICVVFSLPSIVFPQ